MSEISKNNQTKVKEAQDVKSKIEGKTIKIEMSQMKKAIYMAL